MMRALFAALVALALTRPAAAAPETYTADPGHTYPSFEVVHQGFTITRGMFLKSSGKIVLDRAAHTGSVEITIDAASVTTGMPRRDDILRANWFKVEQYPSLLYKSQNLKFSGDTLVGADGELTMLGVTRPVALVITSFNCRANPANKHEQCGADGYAAIKRTEFGMTNPISSASDDVKILFQIEAYKE